MSFPRLLSLLPLSLAVACGDVPADFDVDAGTTEPPVHRVHVTIGNGDEIYSNTLVVYDAAGKTVSTQAVEPGSRTTLLVPDGGTVARQVDPFPSNTWPRNLAVAGITGPDDQEIDLTDPFVIDKLDELPPTTVVDAAGVPEGTIQLVAASPCGRGGGYGDRVVVLLETPPCTGQLVTIALPGRHYVSQDAARLTSGEPMVTPSTWAPVERTELALTGIPTATQTSYIAALYSGAHVLLELVKQPISSPRATVFADHAPGLGLSLVETVTSEVIEDKWIIAERTVTWTRPADAIARDPAERNIAPLLPLLPRPTVDEHVVRWRLGADITDIDYARVAVTDWRIIAPAGSGELVLPEHVQLNFDVITHVTLVDHDEADRADYSVALAAPARAAAIIDRTAERTRFPRVRTTNAPSAPWWPYQ